MLLVPCYKIHFLINLVILKGLQTQKLTSFLVLGETVIYFGILCSHVYSCSSFMNPSEVPLTDSIFIPDLFQSLSSGSSKMQKEKDLIG